MTKGGTGSDVAKSATKKGILVTAKKRQSEETRFVTGRSGLFAEVRGVVGDPSFRGEKKEGLPYEGFAEVRLGPRT